MTDLKTQLRNYQAQLDARYQTVTIEEVPAPTTTHVRGRTWTPVGRWRRVFAFGLAFFVVLALGIAGSNLLFTGSDEPDLGPAEPSTSITAPQTTTEVPRSTTTEPVETATTATTSSTTTTAAPDALPGDAPIAFEGWVSPELVRGTIDAEGLPVFVYWDWERTAMVVARCSDAACDDYTQATLATLPTFFIEGEDYPPQIDDITLLDDGTLVALIWSADQTQHTLYVCDDVDCSSVRSAPLDLGDAWGHPQLAVAPDGTLRVVRWGQVGSSLDLIVCRDPLCSPATRTNVTIEPGVWPLTDPSLDIDDEGRVFIGYTLEGRAASGSAVVAVCDDDTCSNGAVSYRIDSASEPQVTSLPDGRFLVWYRRGPVMLGEGDLDFDAMLANWQLVVAECRNGTCEPRSEFMVGWPLLHVWFDVVFAADAGGDVAVAAEYWDPESCSLQTDMAVLGGEPPYGSSVLTLESNGLPVLLASQSEGSWRVWYIDPTAGALQSQVVDGDVRADPPRAETDCP